MADQVEMPTASPLPLPLEMDDDHSFVDALVCSTQPRSAPLTGVRGLMLAVLEDGIRTYLIGSGRDRSEAEDWVRSHRRDSPFSFSILCEQFSLDPSAVRVMLVQMRDRPDSCLKIRTRPNARRARRMTMPRRSSAGKRGTRWRQNRRAAAPAA